MIRRETDGAVTRLVLDRPERRNALNGAMTEAIHDGVCRAADDLACRVVVIEGSAGHFCAGRDLSGDMAPKDLAETMAADRLWADIFRRLDGMAKISIAAVDGFAVAGGFTLAMGCDFVLATRAARFGAAEMKIGFPAAVNTPILAHLVGPRLALELIIFGDRVSAERLYEMGLINQVAEDAAALEALQAEWLERLLALDPEAIALTKESHRAARSMPLADALTMGAQQNALLKAAGAFEAGAARYAKRKSTDAD